MQILNFRWQRGFKPSVYFRAGLTEKLVVKTGISCVGISLMAAAVQALRSKMYSAKRVFPRGGVFSPNLNIENCVRQG
jgi:hypothetical protein